MIVDVAQHLHSRFNPKRLQIPPVSLKRFTRVDLIRLFPSFGFKTGAEIGTGEGKFAELMCRAIPDLKLWCIDPWERYPGNPRAQHTDVQENSFRQTQERLAPFPNVQILRTYSMDCVNSFSDNSLDFAYIDANHCFDFFMRDLIEWGKKVRVGGIISGDDYYRFNHAGVVEAVDAYTRAHQIHEWFITREAHPTFFWVKGDR